MSKSKPLCRAPFANIYIDGDGNITPCCFNRNDILGNIYTDEWNAVWNGDKALHLRKALSQQIFPSGCHLCKKMMEQGNYYNSGIYTYNKLNYKTTKIQSIDFELSYYCNLSCIMCNLHEKQYRLSKEQETVILEKLKPLIPTLKKTRFYGGEPLVIPIYQKIWERIIKENPQCNILIQTNGMIINESIENLAKGGNFTFNISLDSLDAENLSRIRKGANLSLILENLKQYKKQSKNSLTLTVTPMRLNWKEIPDMVRFATKEHIQIFLNTLIQPKKLSIWTLPNASLQEIQQYYDSITLPVYSSIHLFNRIKFKHFARQIHEAYRSRPHYSSIELEKIMDETIKILKEKIPSQPLDETLIRKFLTAYLEIHKKEEVLHFINSSSEKELLSKIQNLLPEIR